MTEVEAEFDRDAYYDARCDPSGRAKDRYARSIEDTEQQGTISWIVHNGRDALPSRVQTCSFNLELSGVHEFEAPVRNFS